MSRYLFGTTGMESCDSKAWKHSKVGFKYMEDWCYIGDLYTPENDQEWILRQKGGSQAAFTEEKRTMVSKTTISQTTFGFEFHNPKYEIKLNPLGIDWLGKHWILGDDKKMRLYTNCIMLDPKVVKYRDYLTSHYKQVTGGDEIQEGGKENQQGGTLAKVEYPESSENLILVIKEYIFKKALSHKLAQASTGSEWMLEGMIGAGLEIHQDFSGVCIIVAAGTGILPFIDLLDLLYKKALYRGLKKQGADTSVVKPEQDYEAFFPGAKFKLFCAFRTIEDFIGYEWIGHLAELSNQHEMGLFECIARVKADGLNMGGIKTTQDYFNKEFFERNATKQRFEKLWVCGPPKMHVTVFDDFVSLGTSPDKILFI